MDQSDAWLRARMASLVAAAPAAPLPEVSRSPVTNRRRMRRLALAVTLGALLLAAIAAAGLPSLGRVDLQSQLDAMGVPTDAQIVAIQAGADGRVLTVVYRDGAGKVHTIGGVDRRETPAPGRR